MTNTQTTDIDAQIVKLEEKLNNLLDKIQEAQSISVESNSSDSGDLSTIKNTNGKSRKEILAEYEKEYLKRLEAQQHAEEEILRASDDKESQNMKNSTRGTLPKGF